MPSVSHVPLSIVPPASGLIDFAGRGREERGVVGRVSIFRRNKNIIRVSRSSDSFEVVSCACGLRGEKRERKSLRECAGLTVVG